MMLYTIDAPGLMPREHFDDIKRLAIRLAELVGEPDRVIGAVEAYDEWRGETKDGWSVRVFRQRVRGFR